MLVGNSKVKSKDYLPSKKINGKVEEFSTLKFSGTQRWIGCFYNAIHCLL